ncbi:MAG: hypothetical protein NVS3B7_05710 [Candidatus Elarobacter sp.]
MTRAIFLAAAVASGGAVLASAASAGVNGGVNAVADPGFESGGTQTWQQCGSGAGDARVVRTPHHSGTYALRAGSTSRSSGEVDGDVGVCQRVTIPPNGVLSFWFYGLTNETSTEFSYQEAELLDKDGYTFRTLWRDSVTTNGWAKKTVDVSSLAGTTARLYFGVHGNGYAKTYTILYVDDVVLQGGAAPGPSAPPAATPISGEASPAPSATAGPTPIPEPSNQTGATCGSACGTERWHVKTMSDPQASQVNRAVRMTTVDELIHAAVPVPPSGTLAKADNVRFAPWELQAVRIRATIVGWKTENDNDFHIVVSDLNDPRETMIVEPPSPSCSSACSSGYGALYRAARDAFTQCLGQVPATFAYLQKPVVADITGVPFFDPIHGQTGVAPNGIEIHPVISVSFVSGC